MLYYQLQITSQKEKIMRKILTLIEALCFILLFGSCFLNNPDTAWLTGYWVYENPSNPWTKVEYFNGSGTLTEYNNYAMSSGSLSLPYTFDGTTLSAFIATGSVTKISNNEFDWATNLGTKTYYRTGYEPDGNKGTPLTYNVWQHSSFVSMGDTDQYFTFSATGGQTYKIQWDDSSEGTGNMGDIKVSVYGDADLSTPYFTNIDKGYNSPLNISPSSNETIYIDATNISLGSFELRYYQ
jgi:hypothetical protein